MTAKHIPRLTFGVLGVALLVLLPTVAAAQSTFLIPFDRTGVPGTAQVTDPLTGELVMVDTGAFNNPCTQEFVDVTGSSLIKISDVVAKNGTRTITVDVSSKGDGFGWLAIPEPQLDPFTGKPMWAAWDILFDPTFTGSTYAFADNQTFSLKVNSASTTVVSDFTDKFVLRGDGALDNWVIKAVIRVKVVKGQVLAEILKMTLDPVCKG